MPVHVHDFLNRVRKVTIEMTDKNGKLPTDEDLAIHLECTVVRIQVKIHFIIDITVEMRSSPACSRGYGGEKSGKYLYIIAFTVDKRSSPAPV